MEKIQVQVTQAHIDTANPESLFTNAVALAYNDARTVNPCRGQCMPFSARIVWCPAAYDLINRMKIGAQVTPQNLYFVIWEDGQPRPILS